MIMGVTVSLPLFGNPGRELEEGEPIEGSQLRKLATDLHERLQRCADLIDQLALDGWATQVAMFDVLLHHREVQTREQAVARLRALGADPDTFLIVEDVEEEEAGAL
jgi:hypothetical protein